MSNSCATDDRCEREGAIVHGQDLGSAVHHQCLLQVVGRPYRGHDNDEEQHIHQPVAEGAHARAVDDAVVAAVSLHPTAVSRDHADQRSEAAARNHGHRRDDRTQQQPDQNVFARVWPSAVRSQSSLYIGASRFKGGRQITARLKHEHEDSDPDDEQRDISPHLRRIEVHVGEQRVRVERALALWNT